MGNVPELPRDVQLRIVSFADMDARRALGLYRRLCVPERVKDLLSRTLEHMGPKSPYRHALQDFHTECRVIPHSSPRFYAFRTFRRGNMHVQQVTSILPCPEGQEPVAEWFHYDQTAEAWVSGADARAWVNGADAEDDEDETEGQQ